MEAGLDDQNGEEHVSNQKPDFSDDLHLHVSNFKHLKDEALNKNLQLVNDVELSVEKSQKVRVCFQSLDMVKECVYRVIEMINEVNTGNYVETDELNPEDSEDSMGLYMEIRQVHSLAMRAESRLTEYVEMTRKEKKELENSVVSLTEENRDINSLLRIALAEKEAVERALSRLKGGGEQKKVALLQFAERGLQKVGFGFMISNNSMNEESDNSGSNMFVESESEDCEEEVVSLALTVEKMMKNMRLEIAQLKQDLEESRSETERLQSITEKQAQEIADCRSHINDLKERESGLAKKVEQLMMEITEAQEEVKRWREACEMEVEAGRHAIEQHEREALNLREELEKTKTSVDTLGIKIKLKEQLAATAIAAQEAAQKSLQVADRRAAELHERIEELMKQLEVADSREERNIRRKVRHICWPWRMLKENQAASRSQIRRMKPEMQGLLLCKI